MRALPGRSAAAIAGRPAACIPRLHQSDTARTSCSAVLKSPSAWSTRCSKAMAEPEDSAQDVLEPSWRPYKLADDWQHGKPPADAEALTSDGQLLKLTLREGSGELPPKHARCLGEGSPAPHCWKPRGQARRCRIAAAAPDQWASPPLPAPFAVHYVGRLAANGEVFMDTRQESQTEEPEEVVAGRGE